jgi:hypothetical protein
MPPLSNVERQAAYRDALGNWSYAGYIGFELTEQAYAWIRRELDGITLKELGRLMHDYVAGGGEIDEVRETRPEWSGEYLYHYDLRFEIQGQPVYIETRLKFRPPFKPDEPTILVVNVHAQ